MKYNILMKPSILLIALSMIFLAGSAKASDFNAPPSPGMVTIIFENPVAQIDSIHAKPDVDPQFPGGQEKLLQHMQTHIRYPLAARNARVQGTVFVKYIVEPSGEISNVQIMRSVSPELDEEAMRVVNLMPKWEPGLKDGAAVGVQYVLPVRFVM
jgi:TonB family protein